jgi:hypothetical protein
MTTVLDCLNKINLQESKLEITTIYKNFKMYGTNWKIVNGILHGLKIKSKNPLSILEKYYYDDDHDDDGNELCSLAVGINEITEIHNDGIQIYCCKIE